MAGSINTGGCKTLQSSSREGLEDAINTFLKGDGTTEDPPKVIEHIQFAIDSSVFYTLIIFRNSGQAQS